MSCFVHSVLPVCPCMPVLYYHLARVLPQRQTTPYVVPYCIHLQPNQGYCIITEQSVFHDCSVSRQADANQAEAPTAASTPWILYESDIAGFNGSKRCQPGSLTW